MYPCHVKVACGEEARSKYAFTRCWRCSLTIWWGSVSLYPGAAALLGITCIKKAETRTWNLRHAVATTMELEQGDVHVLKWVQGWVQNKSRRLSCLAIDALVPDRWWPQSYSLVAGGWTSHLHTKCMFWAGNQQSRSLIRRVVLFQIPSFPYSNDTEWSKCATLTNFNEPQVEIWVAMPLVWLSHDKVIMPNCSSGRVFRSSFVCPWVEGETCLWWRITSLPFPWVLPSQCFTGNTPSNRWPAGTLQEPSSAVSVEDLTVGTRNVFNIH